MENQKKEVKMRSLNIILVMCMFFIILLAVVVFAATPSFTYFANWSEAREDTPFIYNFSANVTGGDGALTFLIDSINSTNHSYSSILNYYWISINSTTGLMAINTTNNNETAKFNISIYVKDSTQQGESRLFYFNVSAVNDAPIFQTLTNKSFNDSTLFEYVLTATDEEGNVPFNLSINFTSCYVAQWSSRNCSNSSGRALFNSSQYSFDGTTGILNISFTPLKNDVGNYTLNLTINDSSGAIRNQIVNFSVFNNNSAPYFRYVCDNERNATENSEFRCWINASDIDESINLTIASNFSWFKFNNSVLNVVTLPCNITTSYNVSAMVNFTPSDLQVGNWSINITANDTSSPLGLVSTIIWFFINNTEDPVILNPSINVTLYRNETIYVNATDNDLLVPDKRVKNESLTFASNTSWVSISSYSTLAGTNYTTAKIDLNYNAALAAGQGNYTVRINVTDTIGNTSQRNFTVQVLGDNAASWSGTMANVFSVSEGTRIYLNFSQNVTDADNDRINFTYTLSNSFPSFSLNLTTGIINFTTDDTDVGYHNITINASDGKLDSLKSFNFTINNVNDAPVILSPLTVLNATIDSVSNINVSEDNLTRITLYVEDNDLKIPVAQSGFYSESLNLSLLLSGPNTRLFSFSYDSLETANRSKYIAIFTPNKTDVGLYNATITVIDNSSSSFVIRSNLSIVAISHSPVLFNISNQTSAINRSFYLYINATDREDIDNSYGSLFFNVSFLSGIDFVKGNQSIFNLTSGFLNITFNSSQSGIYHINASVRDSSGLNDSKDFWLFVYGFPVITSPAVSNVFSLKEGSMSNLSFSLNHSVGDNLTCDFYVSNGGFLRESINCYGNNSNTTWRFTPNFTDESHNVVTNLTLVAYPSNINLSNRSFFNITRSWNVSINHTNAPVNFTRDIGRNQADYLSNIRIDLKNYLSDPDHFDSAYNQTVNFTITSSSSPSNLISSVSSDWILTINSSVQSAFVEFLTINATDIDTSTNASMTSDLSNAIEIEFTVPSATTTVVSSGGGGGGATMKHYSLKIITPGDTSIFKKDRIIVPIVLKNTGQIDFNNISLTSSVSINGINTQEVQLSIAKTHIERLAYGNSEDISLEIFTNTNNEGRYRVSVFANVGSPSFSDWGEFYIDIKAANASDAEGRIVFTEKLIAENPECLELTELLNEAKKSFENGDYKKSYDQAEAVVEACKKSVSGENVYQKKDFVQRTFYYLSLVTLGSFILGFIIYIYRRVKFNKQDINEYA